VALIYVGVRSSSISECLVLVAQAFLKVAILNALAPTQSIRDSSLLS